MEKLITILVIFFMFSVLSCHQSAALRCYICGDPGNFLYANYKEINPVSCDELNELQKNNNTNSDKTGLDKFIIECPAEYQGCITQIQGDRVTRTCDVFPIDDCQKANGITYCYCSYDLCNINDDIKISQLQTKSHDSTKNVYYDKDDFDSQLIDDEDYNESSGDNSMDYTEKDSAIQNNAFITTNPSTRSTIINILSTFLSTSSPPTVPTQKKIEENTRFSEDDISIEVERSTKKDLGTIKDKTKKSKEQLDRSGSNSSKAINLCILLLVIPLFSVFSY